VGLPALAALANDGSLTSAGDTANMPKRHTMELSLPAEANLIAGARDTQPVRGLTHNFYRYPARFSPAFVRCSAVRMEMALRFVR
jgi:hypothetical protein